jgi:hypothetical protein
MISHLRGKKSTSYFKPSTPLGSTITKRKIIGSSCPHDMHIYEGCSEIIETFFLTPLTYLINL